MAAVPQDLLDRLAALERAVRQLTGRANIRPALNEINGGAVKIGEGGSLEVIGPNGESAFRAGQWPQDGSYGTRLGRDDGTAAWTVGGSGTDTNNMVRMWSRDLNAPARVLIMDDAFSDRFLGRPWMPLDLHPTERQSYTGTTYEPAWAGRGPVWNAVAEISLMTYANTGGGQVKVTRKYNGTETTLDEWDCPANAWTSRVVTAPMDSIDFMDTVEWTIYHRAKSASQNVESRLWRAISRNTITADETPTDPVRTTATVAATAPAADEQAATDTAPSTAPALRPIDD
ncbi:hypothetical protein ABZZ74_49180 [Streptomyces sp. NPDC006476]|uniref:hypothetical protein n=1 Tax=Streptomyces sp. NPDC006476 TaxID=3157175 RepID=UPI0033B769D4